MMTDRERDKADPTGLVQSLQEQDNSGSLLMAPVIDQLVRRFIADVVDVLDKAQREGINREAGAATVEANSRYYAGVMTGRVALDGFHGGGDWLVRGLPLYLAAHHGIRVAGEEAIAEAFAKIAQRVFAIVTKPEGHEAQLDRLVRSSVALFGGMGGDVVP